MKPGTLRRRQVRSWLAVAVMASLALFAGWLAFGGGRRPCTAGFLQSLVRLFALRSDLPCRAGYVLATAVAVALLLAAVRHALRAPRALDN